MRLSFRATGSDKSIAHLGKSTLASVRDHRQRGDRLLMHVSSIIMSIACGDQSRHAYLFELLFFSSLKSRSTIGSKNGTRVSRATPSQKLMRAAAACACTLGSASSNAGTRAPINS